MKTLYKDIKIPKIKKDSLIKDSKLFSYIDSDFTNYGASKLYPNSTKAQTLVVKEITENGTFKQLFNSPETQWLTQGQILFFIKHNKEQLQNNEYATFFLFKVEDRFFVASVRVSSDGLRVDVSRFEHAYVWGAGYRHRMVVPATNDLDSNSLNPSETESLIPLNVLTDEQAIEHLKNNGFRVSKEF